MVAEDGMGVVGPSVGGTLGSLFGGTVGYGFTGTVSVSDLSGIRVRCVTADAENVGVDLVLVDGVFLHKWCILPFAASLLSGRYFRAKLTARPVQVAKKLRLMVAIHVFFGGHRQYWCRYMVRFFLFCIYKLSL